jgi:hypothetical protein
MAAVYKLSFLTGFGSLPMIVTQKVPGARARVLHGRVAVKHSCCRKLCMLSCAAITLGRLQHATCLPCPSYLQLP